MLVEGAPCRAVLCVITSFFSSNVERHAILQNTLSTVKAWQLRRVHTVVVTQNGTATRAMLAQRGAATLVDELVVRAELSSYALSHGQLTWEHRGIVERHRADFDLFVYLEDDARLTWASLKSWAADEALLQTVDPPGTFHRSFFRYERLQLAGLGRSARGVPTSAHPGHYLKDQSRSYPCLPSGLKNLSSYECNFEVGGRRFVGLSNPFAGSWLMGRARLAAFINSSQWRLGVGGKGRPIVGLRRTIGSKEAAAFGDAFLGENRSVQPLTRFSYGAHPHGCPNAMLVPFVMRDGFPMLDLDAALEHLGARASFRPANNWLRVGDCLAARRPEPAPTVEEPW